LNNHNSSSFQEYEHKDISVHSVDVIKHASTSFNGAVYDASKSVKQRNMKITQTNPNLSTKKNSQQFATTSQQARNELLKDFEAQSQSSMYN
jgi:hypothetical protein